MPEPDLSALRRDPAPAATVPTPRSRWRTRVLLPGGLLLAFAALLAWSARDALLPRVEVRAVPVVVKEGASGGGGRVGVQAAGWVEPDPYPLYVTSLADGVVQEVLVLEGERVEKGQVVARLVPEDARLALARAEAERDARRADLEAAEKDWENPVERRRAVAAASAALEAAGADHAEAGAMAEAEDARVREAEALLARDRRQAAAGAEPAFSVVQGELRLEALRASARALDARRDAAAGRVKEAGAGDLAAREGLRLRIEEARSLALSRAESARAEAALGEARLRVERIEIRAPAAGVVLRRLAAPGTKLMLLMDDPLSSTPIALYDPARLQVRVDVPLADAAGVGVGGKAEILVEVLPGRVFRGEVTRVVQEADIQKNTLQFKVRLVDPDPAVRPEMLAKVRFRAESPGPAAAGAEGGMGGGATGRVFAPERLLLRSGAGDHAQAFVLDAGGGRAVLRHLTLGPGREDGWAEVAEGLSPGDAVLDAPAGRLADGTRVLVTGEGR